MEDFFYNLSIEELRVNDLKVIAREMKIDRYYWMRKKELISAIEAVKRGEIPQKPQKPPVKAVSFCEHKKLRYFCKECGGNGICEHGGNKFYCKECDGNQICEHKKSRYFCKECGGKGICEHGRNRQICKECKKAV